LRIVIVGARISVGTFSRFTTSKPKTVLPEPAEQQYVIAYLPNIYLNYLKSIFGTVAMEIGN